MRYTAAMFHDDEDKQSNNQPTDPRDGVIEDLRMQVRRLEDRLSEAHARERDLSMQIVQSHATAEHIRTAFDSRKLESEAKLEAVRAAVGANDDLYARIKDLEERLQALHQRELTWAEENGIGGVFR